MLVKTLIRTQDVRQGDHFIDPDGGYIAEVVRVLSITEQEVHILRQEGDDEPFELTMPTDQKLYVNRPVEDQKATAAKKVFTEAEIREKLESDWQWQRRALLRLYELQTPHEQAVNQTRFNNSVGFTAAHSRKLTSFAKQLIAGKKFLSHKQMHYVKKWLPCYAGQLHRVTYGN